MVVGTGLVYLAFPYARVVKQVAGHLNWMIRIWHTYRQSVKPEGTDLGHNALEQIF